MLSPGVLVLTLRHPSPQGAAEALSSLVRNELRPLLRPATAAPRRPPAADRVAALQRWDGLLYAPAWMPRGAPGRNLCQVPAVAETLDQCGGLG